MNPNNLCEDKIKLKLNEQPLINWSKAGVIKTIDKYLKEGGVVPVTKMRLIKNHKIKYLTLINSRLKQISLSIPKEYFAIKIECPTDYFKVNKKDLTLNGINIHFKDNEVFKYCKNKQLILFKGGKIIITQTGVIDTFEFIKGTPKRIPKLRSINDIKEYLINHLSRIKYNKEVIGKPISPEEFIKNGGVCTHAAWYMHKILKNNNINSKVLAGMAYDLKIDGKIYYQPKSKNIPEHPASHRWVEFEIKGKHYVLEPTTWMHHYEAFKDDWEEAIKWLTKYALYEQGRGPSNKFFYYPILIAKIIKS